MRISLGGDNKKLVAASWLDKRDFEGGYDVYAAVSEDGGKTFGTDELVQDMFGENTPQWHNAIAVSNKGQIVVTWDDTRDGLPRIWLSERRHGNWSADTAINDPEEEIKESHPVICFDSLGRLHIAYVQQGKNLNRIIYIMGETEQN